LEDVTLGKEGNFQSYTRIKKENYERELNRLSWKNPGAGRWFERGMYVWRNNRSLLGWNSSSQTALALVNKQHTEPLMQRLTFFI